MSTQSNLTAGFIDLATFDDLERHLYGGPDAVSYFIRKIRKSTWFTICPVVLSKNNGNPSFGAQWGVNISRAGDFLLRAFMRVQIPSVTINASGNQFGANGRIRWTRNLAHALIQEMSITFNDLQEWRADSYYLDSWSAFAMPPGKKNGYQNMIGNIEDLTNPLGISASGGITLPAATLNVPLPICHARDTGVGLPTAALPFNEMKMVFQFRDWTQLLILDNILVPSSTAGQPPVSGGYSVPATISDVVSVPAITQCDVWAEYALVANAERQKMGTVARDILIEQVQTVPVSAFNAISPTTTDIRLAHAVKAIFFKARNKTNAADWANYTAASPVPTSTGVIFFPDLAADPIASVSLYYESQLRLAAMGSDYFSLINPWYTAVSIPTETGYHLYSFSLDLISVNPMGSTNFGRLTNVSLSVTPSPEATTSATTGGTLAAPNRNTTFAGAAISQVFDLIVVAINHNLIRVTSGTIGFPIL